MLEVTELGQKANQGRPFYWGMLSFALEEMGRMDEAAKAAQEGLRIDPNDPWVHHAFAHVYYFSGEIDAGIKVLQEHSSKWRRLCPFIKTHNWWHLALFRAEGGDADAA